MNHNALSKSLPSATYALLLAAPLVANVVRQTLATLARVARVWCWTVTPSDRQDCLARMQGQGTTSGAAASGGIYRELVRREVVAPGTAVPLSLPPGEPAK